MILHCFPPTRMGTTDKSNKKKPQLQQDGTQYSQRFNKMFPVGFEKLFSRVPQFTLQQRIKLPFIRPDGEADLGKSQVRVPVDTFFIHGFLKSRVGGLHGTHSFFPQRKQQIMTFCNSKWQPKMPRGAGFFVSFTYLCIFYNFKLSFVP